jgi:hypothetical protein
MSLHLDEMFKNLNMNNTMKFNDISLRFGEVFDSMSAIEQTLVLEIELLGNMMDIANLTLHHHIDELEDLLEDLGISIDDAFVLLSTENSGNHLEIISHLLNLTTENEGVQGNISEIISHINGMETSLQMLDEIDNIITNIESRQVNSDDSIDEVSKSNDSIKTFQLIIIGLLVLSVILVAVVIVLLLMKKKDEKPENWDKN